MVVVGAGRIPAVAVQGHPLAGAEPALYRTDVRGDHRHPVGIAMGEAGASVVGHAAVSRRTVSAAKPSTAPKIPPNARAVCLLREGQPSLQRTANLSRGAQPMSERLAKTPQAPAETVQGALLQTPTVAAKREAEKFHAARTGPCLRLALVQLQPQPRQPLDNRRAVSPKLALRVAEQQQIVGVAHVTRHAQ